jgi:hypothetical protein
MAETGLITVEQANALMEGDIELMVETGLITEEQGEALRSGDMELMSQAGFTPEMINNFNNGDRAAVVESLVLMNILSPESILNQAG